MHTTSDFARADTEAIRRWRAMRLGMFIHWGPVSLRGTEIGWSRGGEVAVEDYDSLYREFNPALFDADEWVSIAKDAGMRYVVLTTKHHDGFCLWPTRQSDYHIGNTPFRRDVVGELAAACRRQGLAFGAYYSICDWRHSDYPLGSPAGRTSKPQPNMDRYDAYLRAQLEELQNDYGPLLYFWFDGEWEAPWTHERGVQLNNWLHQLQTDLLVNNRVGKGRQGTQGTSDPLVHPGDFWTAEQEVGAFHRDFPWESCITIGRQWAWKPNDVLKSCDECLGILTNTIGGDGNLLLNVGPMPDGRIEARQVQRLHECGAFVRRHAEAIYGTRGGPFKPGPWGCSTCRDRHVYLFLRKPPSGTKVALPTLGDAHVRRATAEDGTEVAVAQRSDALLVTPPAWVGSDYALVRLEVDRPAVDIVPVDTRVPAPAERKQP